jgi:ketosteroid isomerase-like protein
MPESDPKSIATTCLRSWTSGDFETTRSVLADDATFLGPLGETSSADAYVEGVRGFAGTIERVDIHDAIADSDNVCIAYDLVTKGAGSIPTVGWYRIRDGKVASVRAYFDPRPLL